MWRWRLRVKRGHPARGYRHAPENFASPGLKLKELLRTNNAVRLSYALALLRDRGLSPVVFDEHMSILDGSIGALPRRLMIEEADFEAAKRILIEAQVLDPDDEDAG